MDVTNPPTVPGEIRFRHPTVEGTQVVISITTDGVMSRVESLEGESASLRGDDGSKQREGVLG